MSFKLQNKHQAKQTHKFYKKKHKTKSDIKIQVYLRDIIHPKW